MINLLVIGKLCFGHFVFLDVILRMAVGYLLPLPMFWFMDLLDARSAASSFYITDRIMIYYKIIAVNNTGGLS